MGALLLVRNKWAAVVICFYGAACATGLDVDPPSATLEVVEISPAPELPVDESTVLTMTVRYEIDSYSSQTDYRLMPVFDHVDGNGKTFAPGDWSSSYPVRSPRGVIRISVSLREAMDGRLLRRPIGLWLYLAQESGVYRKSLIVSAGPYVFYEKH